MPQSRNRDPGYVITVTNNGPSDATGVVLSEDLTLSDADADVPNDGRVRVTLFDSQSDGAVELVTSAGPDELLPVRTLETPSLSEVDAFFAFGGFASGVFVS